MAADDLTVGQKVPDMTGPEAAGATTGAIAQDSSQYQLLLLDLDNPDFAFDPGVTRKATARLREKLNTLATLVQQEWPGVRLNINAAWDPADTHSSHSMHHEGRAADLGTSDKDKKHKYGRLGRLAVNAGLDFVFYEDENHIHAAVAKDVLTVGQRVPNQSWDTAVGAPTHSIALNSADYRTLVTNNNENIVFRDGQNRGLARVLGKDLSDALDVLANLVTEEWTGVNLRVLVGWSQQTAPPTLYNEGRAAIIATSDLDPDKLGRLAYFASLASFDWVSYGNDRHVVVAMSSQAADDGPVSESSGPGSIGGPR